MLRDAFSLWLPLRLLRGRRLRLALAVLAIAIAVAGVCAADLVHGAILRAFSEVTRGVTGPAALQVTAGDGGLFRARLADGVAEVPGVELIIPILSATAFAADDGDAVTVQGLEIGKENVVHAYESSGAARFDVRYVLLIRNPDAVILARSLATRRGLAIGDPIELQTPTGRHGFIVSGLLETDGMARALGENLVVMPLDAAQRAFGQPGLVSRVDVVVRRDASVASVARAIAGSLPRGVQVGPPVQRTLDLEKVEQSVALMLWGAALVGVVLSFLVAFNRLETYFGSRAWEAGLLRAIGVRAGVVWRELLKESLLVGAAGVLLGLPLGIGLGRILLPLVAATASVSYDLAVLSTGLPVRVWPLVAAAAVGLVAALLAAALPAWRAARVPPAEALRWRGIEARAMDRGAMWLLRGATLGAAVSAVVLQHVTRSPTWGLIATLLIVVTTALLARPTLHLLQILPGSSWLAGPAAQVVRGALVHNPRRTALTVSMVAVGLGCVVWILTLAFSFEQSLVEAVGATLRADLIVASSHVLSGWMPAPIDDGILPELLAVPGVMAVAGNRVVEWRYGQRSVAINAFDAAYFTNRDFGRPSLVRASLPDVWDAVAQGEGAIVSSNFARNFDARVGDTIELETPSGPLALPIVGAAMAFLSPAGTIEMAREAYSRLWHDHQVNRVWVRTKSGADPAVVARTIGDTLGPKYDLRVFSSAGMLDHLVAQVRRAFAPVQVARAVVLLVVLLGTADTLVANVLERLRDFGTLRAVGVRRRGIRRIVLAEGLAIGALGLLLACPLGLGLAALWTRTTFTYLLGWEIQLHPPYGHIALLAATTLVVCAGAALLPADRAAKLQPAVALREE